MGHVSVPGGDLLLERAPGFHVGWEKRGSSPPGFDCTVTVGRRGRRENENRDFL